MERQALENVVSANDDNYNEKLFRSEKAVTVLYAGNCEHSMAVLDALYEIAAVHRDIIFVTVMVRDMKDPPEKIIARAIHDIAKVNRYPTLVAYEKFIMKDKIVSERSTAKEQIAALEEFIFKNFPAAA